MRLSADLGQLLSWRKLVHKLRKCAARILTVSACCYALLNALHSFMSLMIHALSPKLLYSIKV